MQFHDAQYSLFWNIQSIIFDVVSISLTVIVSEIALDTSTVLYYKVNSWVLLPKSVRVVDKLGCLFGHFLLLSFVSPFAGVANACFYCFRPSNFPTLHQLPIKSISSWRKKMCMLSRRRKKHLESRLNTHHNLRCCANRNVPTVNTMNQASWVSEWMRCFSVVFLWWVSYKCQDPEFWWQTNSKSTNILGRLFKLRLASSWHVGLVTKWMKSHYIWENVGNVDYIKPVKIFF